MPEQLRVGIIGCGRMARNHVRGYAADDRFHVTGLSDLHESAMDEIDQSFALSTTHYADANRLLEAEDLDGLSVCTWHADHAPWTIDTSGTTSRPGNATTLLWWMAFATTLSRSSSTSTRLP